MVRLIFKMLKIL